MPWVAPTLKTSWPSRAFRTDDLPRLTMPKAAISIVVSSSFWVRSRSCRSSSASAVSSSGVSLRPGQGLLQALARRSTTWSGSRWRSVGPVRRAIRSAPRRRSWCRVLYCSAARFAMTLFAPRGRRSAGRGPAHRACRRAGARAAVRRSPSPIGNETVGKPRKLQGD